MTAAFFAAVFLWSSYVRVRTDQSGPLAYSGVNAWQFWHVLFKELSMNKDQINGKLQDIGGKIQEEAGKLVGNPEQQVKGLKNQAEGKTQEKVGDLKEAVKDATN
jgi:uncharacterized protein YjbJ (UPF0337 family)